MVLSMAFGVKRPMLWFQLSPRLCDVAQVPECLFPHPRGSCVRLQSEHGDRWENENKALGKGLAHSTQSMVLDSVLSGVQFPSVSRHLGCCRHLLRPVRSHLGIQAPQRGRAIFMLFPESSIRFRLLIKVMGSTCIVCITGLEECLLYSREEREHVCCQGHRGCSQALRTYQSSNQKLQHLTSHVPSPVLSCLFCKMGWRYTFPASHPGLTGGGRVK